MNLAPFPAFDGTQACADTPTEVFYPAPGEEAARAVETQRICRGCAFLQPCAMWAITHAAEEGIWGGLTERQRNRIRRESVAAAS